mmetsp:Transcript_9152/g.13795  ORF Transcript_9152/g.13795 Transcript_9152/m.13795 type:complete len:282 (-) Transcript_9152:71-916(-)
MTGTLLESIFNVVGHDNMYLVPLWTLVCIAFHFLSPFISALAIPGYTSRLSSSTRVLWQNRSTSLFHSLVMSGLFFIYWANIHSFRVSDDSIGVVESFSMKVMVGYLIYDLVFEVHSFYTGLIRPSTSKSKSKKKGSIDWASVQIIVHHILGLVSHMSLLRLDCGGGSRYMMGVYGAEISTPFLNLSWLMAELSMKSSPIFIACGLTLIATFLWRNVVGIYILFHMLYNRDIWMGCSTYEGVNVPVLDSLLYNSHLVIIVCFASLNFIWTRKLLLKAMRGG